MFFTGFGIVAVAATFVIYMIAGGLSESESKRMNKLYAVILRKKAYRLVDFEGQVYYTRSRSPSSVPVFAFTGVGKAKLHPDGTCTRPNGKSYYIKTWSEY